MKLLSFLFIVSIACNTTIVSQNSACKLVWKKKDIYLKYKDETPSLDKLDCTYVDSTIQWMYYNEPSEAAFFRKKIANTINTTNDTIVNKAFYYIAYFENKFNNNDTINIEKANAIGVFSLIDKAYYYTLFIKNEKNNFTQKFEMATKTYFISLDAIMLIGKKIVFKGVNNFSVLGLAKYKEYRELVGNDKLLEKIEKY